MLLSCVQLHVPVWFFLLLLMGTKAGHFPSQEREREREREEEEEEEEGWRERFYVGLFVNEREA